jgi:hypothetical protein
MRGRAIPLSASRRFICDLMYFASAVPSIPVQRRMSLGPLVQGRRLGQDRPPWSAIFAKAFALLADEAPEFRRAYCKFPWPHLYEYPCTVASITVEREYRGENAVFAKRIKDPARTPLTDIAAAIRAAAADPVEKVSDFRRLLWISALPRPMRRLLWWLGLNMGRQRANYFGTFAVSVYSSLGAESLHPLSPLTATVNYGVIGANGAVDVRIIYDHRVLDGATVARGLARLEEILLTALLDELSVLPRRDAA